jgi:protein TonB
LVKFIKYLFGEIFLLPLFSKSWDDVVFQNRNTRYGAYELRRQTAKNHFIGLVFTLGMFLGFLFWVYLGSGNSEEYEFEFEKMVEFKGFDANLLKVKPLTKELSHPAPSKSDDKPAPKLKNDNLPPIVKKEVVEEQPSQKVLADTVPKMSEKTGADSSKNYQAGLDSGLVQPHYEEGPASPYGGIAEFMKWVQQNLQVPTEARDNNVHGTVYVHFTIDTTGQITKVTLSKGLGYGCDEAVVEVIRRAPAWKPAIRDGLRVVQRFIIPVKI